MGFEYFYGFLGGETDQWTPFLFRNHTQIFPWTERPGYNLITGMADDAIDYLKGVNDAAPDKPFLLYYVPAVPMRRTSPRQSGSRRSATCTCLIRAGKSCARRSLPIKSGSVSSQPIPNSRRGRTVNLNSRREASEVGYAQSR